MYWRTHITPKCSNLKSIISEPSIGPILKIEVTNAISQELPERCLLFITAFYLLFIYLFQRQI